MHSKGKTSKACYLLGSFGSGKSHFMAVLNLLLQQNATAREIAELADAVTKHNPWTSGKKFMLVPFNSIGATGLEAALLGGYADHIRRHDPTAPTPAVYRAEALFEDAKGLREATGRDIFPGGAKQLGVRQPRRRIVRHQPARLSPSFTNRSYSASPLCSRRSCPF